MGKPQINAHTKCEDPLSYEMVSQIEELRVGAFRKRSTTKQTQNWHHLTAPMGTQNSEHAPSRVGTNKMRLLEVTQDDILRQESAPQNRQLSQAKIEGPATPNEHGVTCSNQLEYGHAGCWGFT